MLVVHGEGCALAGSHNLGLLAGSRCPQTAVCGGVAQTGKSLWEGHVSLVAPCTVTTGLGALETVGHPLGPFSRKQEHP